MYRKRGLLSSAILVSLVSWMAAGCAVSGNSSAPADDYPVAKNAAVAENPDNTGMNYIAEDQSTEKDVLAALSTNPALNANSIGVSCVKGVVTLRGGVGSELEKTLAARIASSVTGVKEVRNLLQAQS